MNIGDIVISINGRDKDKHFIIIKTDSEYSLIANGKTRRIEKPKRKKCKHLKLESKADNIIVEKIKESKLTNNELRRYLAAIIIADSTCDPVS